MSPAAADLPRFSVIESALRRTTELLAREIATPGTQSPQWSQFEWDVARAVSAMQGVTVLLANRLQWRGPDAWQHFLQSQRRLAQQRETRIDSLIARLDAALHVAGVCAVGLKGTALRKLGLYRAGERPMGDVDLLIHPRDFARIDRVMRSVDYLPAFESRRHRVFAPRESAPIAECGEHPDNPLKIEVHGYIGEPLPVRRVDITGNLFPEGMRPGINPYRDNAALMRHLLLHAAGNMRAHALRQVQLHDIAMLGQHIGSSLWDKLLDSPDDQGGCWWMYPALALSARYYPAHACVALQDFAKACPPVLRLAADRDTLTRVSWSNLRIHAFPGLCWSRSPLDVLRYARQRIVPDRQSITELGVVEAEQPMMKQVPWYGLGHSQRILRWVVSRPPRVQTMISLRAALRHPGRSA